MLKEDDISLLMLLNQIQTAEYTQKEKERNMGDLCENAEKMEKRLRAEADRNAKEAMKRMDEAQKKAEEAEKKLRESCKEF